MKCNDCMNEIEVDSQFCPYCGKKVEIIQKPSVETSATDFEEEHEKLRLLYNQQMITQEEYLKRKNDLQQKYGINPYVNYKPNTLDLLGPFGKTSKPWLFWTLALIALIFITTLLQIETEMPEFLAYAINGIMLFLMPTVRK